jgi:glycosyltransferase involved in cell wall biosynthesis
MPKPLACTIVANNYLAYARVFTRSFLERHPDGEVHVLIVDRPHAGHRYEDEPFAVTFADELGIPGFAHFAFRYSILELNTAVKPSFLLHLHEKTGCDRICYFDPDILVLGDLSPLYETLGQADAVLTPHLLAPIEDTLVPSEREILLSGVYNLGFLGIACNERTLPFLDWWRRRLERDCRHEVERGLFVDQRWMDLAPSFLPRAEVLHDPGYNVAYWNLMHRSPTLRDGTWWVGGSPLRFFHFSGYDHRRPDQISKYQNRFTVANRPDVAPLFRLYGERIRAEGHEELAKIPYGYGLFTDGTTVPELARRALDLVDPQGIRWPDPFAAAGRESFLAWLMEPVPTASGVVLNRFALLLWDHRPDLKQAFPHPEGSDSGRFAEWFAGRATGPERVDEIFVLPVQHSLRMAGATLGGQDRSGAAAIATLLPPPGSPVVQRERGLTREEVRWLTADAGFEPRRRPRVPRFAMELHRRRADLVRTFPDPLGSDREPFALWYTTYARMEYQLPAPMIRPILKTLPWRKQTWARLWWERQRMRERRAEAAREAAALTRSALDRPLPVPRPTLVPSLADPSRGLNVLGWSTAPTGVGEACRGTLRALAEAGIAHATWNFGDRGEGVNGPVAAGTQAQGLPYEVSLYHVNADMMETVHHWLPRALAHGRRGIGYWFWELAYFPLCFADAFRYIEELWAPSRFCLEAFRSIAPVEVRFMPPCVVPTTAAPAERADYGIASRDFLFFNAFDALSVPERKNPEGLLGAFARVAQESRVPVHLLLKVNHAAADPELVGRLEKLSEGLPVTLITRPMTRGEMDALTAACDAYVSLHRSEGLGLPLIEAMYLGKPVIATGYGGVTDFLDGETGQVVRHRMTALEKTQGPYPAGAAWAEPDADHAAELMLALAAAPESAADRVAAARRKVSELYCPAAAGERLRRELARLREARPPEAR